MKSGTFTVYHAEDCEPLVYGPGDAFVELPTTVHVGRNETSDPVELGVVFFRVPIGGSPRIDQPQPKDCAVTSGAHEPDCVPRLTSTHRGA